MKILIVDDQKAIADSLARGIRWDEIEIDEVMTANSVAEAKLVLVNFPIDILLTDIEMPEEDGISLVRWIREKKMDIQCIFLTAHADFDYAREAMHLDSVDYILQPARYSEVAEVVSRACGRVKRVKDEEWLRKTRDDLVSQSDVFLNTMVSHLENGNYQGAEENFYQLLTLFCKDEEKSEVFSMKCFMEEKKTQSNAFLNVLVDLLENPDIRICTSVQGMDGTGMQMNILVIAQEGQLADSQWKEITDRFYQFARDVLHLSEHIVTGPGVRAGSREELPVILKRFVLKKEELDLQLPDVIWDEASDAFDVRNEDADSRMEQALEYIQTHIYKNITRTEVCEEIFLNEEYFSRIFKQYTGWTFKDYVMKEKMKLARQLLINTNLSVGVIASKIGFDNFSHFSKTFKKLTDMTPQEYRKGHKKI